MRKRDHTGKTGTYYFDQAGFATNPDVIIEHDGEYFYYKIEVAKNNLGWSSGYAVGFNLSGHGAGETNKASKFNASPEKESCINDQANYILSFIKDGIFIPDDWPSENLRPEYDRKKCMIEIAPLMKFIYSSKMNQVRNDFYNKMLNQIDTLNKELNISSSINNNPMAEFKDFKISELMPDPGQPRTFFDQESMNELAASIRENGVLQPILIRPLPKGQKAKGGVKYMIVCGERRWRSSLSVNAAFKDRDTIPAVMREISDDQALELQLIENLQRESVHPIEEAICFKSLMEQKNYSVMDVANRVGKSDFFVKQRLRLNTLSDKWQKVFFKNHLPLTQALKIAAMPADLQKELYLETVNEENVKQQGFKLTINENLFNKYKGDLTDAPFDIHDASLSKKFGACDNCPFNTAYQNLFPGDTVFPRCTNIPDYKLKTEAAYAKNLKLSSEDPAIVLLNGSYYSSESVKKLVTLGMNILPQDAFEEIEEPKQITWEQFLLDEDYDESDSDNDKDTIPDLQKEFEQQASTFEKRKSEFDKKIATGKFIKGFYADGNRDKGKFVYVMLKKAGQAAVSKGSPAGADAPATAEDITAEIARIREREKRNKDIDLEKIHSNLVTVLKDHKSMKDPKYKINPANKSAIIMQRGLMVFLLLENADYISKPLIKKHLGLNDTPYNQDAAAMDVYFGKLSNLNDEQVQFIIRTLLMQKFSTQTPNHSGGYSLRILAESLGDLPIKKLEKSQMDLADVRIGRVEDRIKGLNKKKTLLSKKPDAKAKKTATKKAANKK